MLPYEFFEQAAERNGEMATYYEIPGGLDWVKRNLHIIIGNRGLDEIMKFGDLWRGRGHKPLVHVISPAMDNGNMWDNHEDPSGLLDNIPSHIDLFIVDFYNNYEPELPEMWWTKEWLLWEYKAGRVKFNGDHQKFIRTFGMDPETPQDPPPSGGGETPAPNPTPAIGTDVTIHMVCPHCGQTIF